MKKALYAFFHLLIVTPLQAQSILSNYDSLPITKAKSSKDVFQLNHPVKQLDIHYKKPEAVSLIPRKSGFFEGALTLLTGIGTGSSTESSWLLSANINSIEKSDAWDALLFVEGEYIKNRERIKNDDGSVSIDTQKGVVIHWDKGAYGLVRHHADTLAVFQVSQELNKDSLNEMWLSTLRNHGRAVSNKLKKYDPYGSGSDLYINGVFRNKPFLLITDEQSYQSLLVINGEPMALFQQNTPYIILSKKDKVRPYILCRSGLSSSESSDFIRLALLTVMVRTYQSKEVLED